MNMTSVGNMHNDSKLLCMSTNDLKSMQVPIVVINFGKYKFANTVPANED